MSYGIRKELDLSFDETLVKVKEELQKQGFGVLTEIDVKKTLQEKSGLEYDNYIILGVCNPHFAYNALQEEKEIGLLLPCNVIIYSEGGKVIISAINPVEAMSIVDNPRLREIAEQVEEKLMGFINNL